MLTEAFKTVLQLSMMGSIVAVFIIMLKPVTGKLIGHKFQYYMWIPVILTMTAFVSPKLIFDVWTVPESINRFEGVRVIAEQTGRLVEAQTEVAGKSISWIQIFSYLWVFGLICFATVILIKYCLFKRVLLKNSVLVSSESLRFLSVEMRTTSALKAPVLIGVLRPRLFIPDTITDETVIENILVHEMVHLKRNDLLYKMVAMLVCFIHWFNPLAYVMVREIGRECEISCDIDATQKMSVAEKKEYMRSVLFVFKNASSINVAFGVGMANKKSLLEKRFSAIEKGHKNKIFFIAIGMLFVFLLQGFAVFAVNTVANIKPLTEVKSADLPSIVVHSPENVRIVEEKEENKLILLPYTKNTNTEEDVLPVGEEPVTETAKEPEIIETASFEDIEGTLKRTGKDYIKTEFNYDGGDTRIIKGIMPDENGRISVAVSSNANEVIEVSFADNKTGKILNGARSFPVNKSGVCVIEDLDKNIKYDVIVRGLLRNNWEIESEIFIY